MNILCNGDRLSIATGATLEQVLSSYLNTAGASPAKGMAVACNGEVIPRHQWSQRPLAEGDRLDLFSAVAGG